MATNTCPECGLPEAGRHYQQERPLLPPNVIEVRLSATFGGVAGQVRWEVEVLEGDVRETVDLIFGWQAFEGPSRDWVAEFLEAVATARTRVAPF